MEDENREGTAKGMWNKYKRRSCYMLLHKIVITIFPLFSLVLLGIQHREEEGTLDCKVVETKWV